MPGVLGYVASDQPPPQLTEKREEKKLLYGRCGVEIQAAHNFFLCSPCWSFISIPLYQVTIILSIRVSLSSLPRLPILGNGDPEEGTLQNFTKMIEGIIHLLTASSMVRVVWISGIALRRRRDTELELHLS